ncbi:hypothetical protein EQG49_06970 [Periweissella cryptocerci]|uniref:Uncharacterized protein n=1 Tax=Periweissella cryptocerci TaxID=2506420 RepID=A0A4P6YU69_9LACO|nr:hypothetical protein [Periweissella cryptocerci]QBO36217.1 hypothetical protein EQG49_06970 [Periweissella cryptocerci]
MTNRVHIYTVMLRLLPKKATILLAIATLSTSLEGIVNAILMGRISSTFGNSSYHNIIQTVLFGLVGYVITWSAMYFAMKLQNNIIAKVDVNITKRYFRDIFVQPSNDRASSISRIQNNIKLIGDNFYRKIFSIVQYEAVATYPADKNKKLKSPGLWSLINQ